MSSTRNVLVHPRRGTVHELWPNGTTRCGNGNTNPVAYDAMKRNQVPPKARGCLTCRRVILSD